MDVGVGLPMRAQTPEDLEAFVTEVEAGPFSSVSLGQRLTFESADPMIVLTYVAAVTHRLRLMTSVLCLPYHKEGVTAQQAATLDRLSKGRFSFGIGLGGRESDFAVAPEAWENRAPRFEAQVEAMRRIWRGEPPFPGTDPVGPTPYTPGGPELIIGGFAPAALRRTGRIGDGLRSYDFVLEVETHLERWAIVMEAWREAGRTGTPRLITAANFTLGPDAQAKYEEHVHKYYGYDPELVARSLAGEPPTTEKAITAAIRRFRDAGIDEMVFTTTTVDDKHESLHRLADAVAAV
jgi:alkanesulfonate monooxygenase SsuD/methylene tetrahydromethanopterin reductase-like flavin-dependent oxidoreductase (luciferase family)